MQIKFNNDDKLGLNQKWIRKIIFTVGLVLTVLSLLEIFYLAFKPKGYENMVTALGKYYILRLIIGLLFLVSWYLMQKSKPVK